MMSAVILAIAFCLLPAYRGISLSGHQWSLGFPFTSLLLSFGDTPHVRVSWLAVPNALLWLAALFLLELVYARVRALLGGAAPAGGPPLLLGVLLVVVLMNMSRFAAGIEELLFSIAAPRAGAVLLLSVFFLVLPTLLAFLLWSLLRIHLVPAMLSILLAITLAATLSLASRSWLDMNFGSLGRAIRTNELAW